MPSVLLVEDDQAIQNMYAFALRQEGFEVSIAGSGGEALTRADERAYDVILLDMLLSGMSGLDFLSTSDVLGKHPETKVVALSNMENPQIVEKAKALGVVAYLNKSEYEPLELTAFVKTLLNPPPTA